MRSDSRVSEAWSMVGYVGELNCDPTRAIAFTQTRETHELWDTRTPPHRTAFLDIDTVVEQFYVSMRTQNRFRLTAHDRCEGT